MPDNNKQRLDLARELVDLLETDQEAEADEVIHRLLLPRESELFQEVGRLTRELHESINGFLLDERISELAEQEMPDASERLRYVITMTEQVAHTTLNAVEAGLPLVGEMERGSKHLVAEWMRFRSRMLSIDEFRGLSIEISEFLEIAQNNSAHLQLLSAPYSESKSNAGNGNSATDPDTIESADLAGTRAGASAGKESIRGHVVIVNVANIQVGLVFDELVGQEEVVIKPLGALLQGLQGMAGATITGDGKIALILDVPSLMKKYARRH